MFKGLTNSIRKTELSRINFVKFESRLNSLQKLVKRMSMAI